MHQNDNNQQVTTGRPLDQPVSHSNTNFYTFFPSVFSKGGHSP